MIHFSENFPISQMTFENRNDVTAAQTDESIISEFNLIADLGAAGLVRSSFFFGWIIGCTFSFYLKL